MTSNNLGNCLITGSSGFVGSRLTDLLFKSGNKIKFISRSHSNNFDVEKCDFLTEDIPIGFFQGIDTVFHLAGLAHDTNNSSSKDDFIKINIDATRKLADIASRQSVKRFIFLSSVKASENLPNNLNVSRKRLYGYTKEKAEQEFDEKEAEAMAEKMSKGSFDLDDFSKQLQQMKKMGGIKGILSLMPGVRKAKKH